MLVEDVDAQEVLSVCQSISFVGKVFFSALLDFVIIRFLKHFVDVEIL